MISGEIQQTNTKEVTIKIDFKVFISSVHPGVLSVLPLEIKNPLQALRIRFLCEVISSNRMISMSLHDEMIWKIEGV